MATAGRPRLAGKGVKSCCLAPGVGSTGAGGEHGRTGAGRPAGGAPPLLLTIKKGPYQPLLSLSLCLVLLKLSDMFRRACRTRDIVDFKSQSWRDLCQLPSLFCFNRNRYTFSMTMAEAPPPPLQMPATPSEALWSASTE